MTSWAPTIDRLRQAAVDAGLPTDLLDESVGDNELGLALQDGLAVFRDAGVPIPDDLRAEILTRVAGDYEERDARAQLAAIPTPDPPRT